MKKKGFTLVELLAVIAILAILVIIALPNVLELYRNARKNAFEVMENGNAYLINLSFVEAVQKEEVILSHSITLPISRARKKEFMAELTADIM